MHKQLFKQLIIKLSQYYTETITNKTSTNRTINIEPRNEC